MKLQSFLQQKQWLLFFHLLRFYLDKKIFPEKKGKFEHNAIVFLNKELNLYAINNIFNENSKKSVISVITLKKLIYYFHKLQTYIS